MNPPIHHILVSATTPLRTLPFNRGTATVGDLIHDLNNKLSTSDISFDKCMFRKAEYDGVITEDSLVSHVKEILAPIKLICQFCNNACRNCKLWEADAVRAKC